MAKRLTDLNLGNDQIEGAGSMQVQGRQVEFFIAEIEELLEDPAFSFAATTLEGIRDTVRQRQQVSEAQREAVQNIRAGGERHEEQRRGWERHERRTGRRYEGWEPSR
jgi:hypothetical protein